MTDYGGILWDITRKLKQNEETRLPLDAMAKAFKEGANPTTQVPPALTQANVEQATRYDPKRSYFNEARGDSLTPLTTQLPSERLGAAIRGDNPRDISPGRAKVADIAQTVASYLPTDSGYTIGTDIGEGDYVSAGINAAAEVGDRLFPGAGKFVGGLAMATVPAARRAAKAGPVTSAAEAMRFSSADLANLQTKYNDTLGDLRVSTRLPQGKESARIGDPYAQDLKPDIASSRLDPEYFEKAVQTMADELLPAKLRGSKSTETKLNAGLEHIIKNLDETYKRLPDEVRDRSQFWYPGGRAIAEDMSKKWGVPVQSAAGGIAGLSPMSEWFVNIDRAYRVGDQLANDPKITQEILDRFKERGPGGMVTKADQLGPYMGQRISQIEDPKDAAIAALAADYANTDPARRYWRYDPEGNKVDYVRNEGGAPARSSYLFTDPVEKAVRAFRSGGDLRTISEDVVGKKNKVRNFYNDIVAPDRTPTVQGRTFGDVTIDTHQGAASSFRPLAAQDRLAQIFLGGAGPSSMKLGTGGLYPFAADATRLYAQRQGLAPSQMQSPVWEGIRGIFPDTFKTPENKAKVEAIWRAYRRKDDPITQQDALNAIMKLPGIGDAGNVPWK